MGLIVVLIIILLIIIGLQRRYKLSLDIVESYNKLEVLLWYNKYDTNIVEPTRVYTKLFEYEV